MPYLRSFLLFLFEITLSLATVANEPPCPHLINNLEIFPYSAVGLITVDGIKGELQTVRGTGTLISQDAILTAGHIFFSETASTPYPSPSLHSMGLSVKFWHKINGPKGNPTSCRCVHILDSNGSYSAELPMKQKNQDGVKKYLDDLAILQTTDSMLNIRFDELAFINLDPDKDLPSRCQTVGYPSNLYTDIPPDSKRFRLHHFPLDKPIANNRWQEILVASLLSFCPIAQGMSGAPVFDHEKPKKPLFAITVGIFYTNIDEKELGCLILRQLLPRDKKLLELTKILEAVKEAH